MNPLQRGSKVATSFLRKTRSLQQLPLMKNITSISKLLLPNQSNQIVRQYSMNILMFFFTSSLSQMEDHSTEKFKGLKEQQDKAIELLGELLANPNLNNEALEQTKLILSGYLISKENLISPITLLIEIEL